MFHFIGKIADSYFLEEDNKEVIVKDVNENASIARYDANLKLLWKCPIKEAGGTAAISPTNTMVYYDGEVGSKFIDKKTGKLIKTEVGVYYYVYGENMAVILRVSNMGVLELHYKGRKSQIPFANSTNRFYGEYVLHAPYEGRLLRCHSLIDGSLLWEIDYTELTGSEKTQLYSDLIYDGRRLYFYFSDLNNISTTFIIDIATGKLVHKIDRFGAGLALDKGCIYAVQVKSVKVMNTETFEVREIDLEGVTNKWLSWNRFVIKDNLLYFNHDRDAPIGIIDLETTKLLWFEDMAAVHKGFDFVTHMQLLNDRLYISSRQHLYIYGKD